MDFGDMLGKGLNYVQKKAKKMQEVRSQMEYYDDERLFDYVKKRRGTQLQRMMAIQILKDRGYGKQ